MVITVIFSVLYLVMLYILITLYRKNVILSRELENRYTNEENYIMFFRSILETYVGVLAKLKRIDRRGSFESDDEIGFVFKTIKNTISELHQQLLTIEKEIIDDSKTEETKKE